jgi:hypothetical protein
MDRWSDGPVQQLERKPCALHVTDHPHQNCTLPSDGVRQVVDRELDQRRRLRQSERLEQQEPLGPSGDSEFFRDDGRGELAMHSHDLPIDRLERCQLPALESGSLPRWHKRSRHGQQKLEATALVLVLAIHLR